MQTRFVALLLTLTLSGCTTTGKLPEKTSSEFSTVQTIELLPVGVPETPRVRILNSSSDWFHIPGFAAKGAYLSYAGSEVGAILESAGFDYGVDTARLVEDSIGNAGMTALRPDGAAMSDHRKLSLRKCPKQTEAEACLDVYLTYFGYVAATDSSDYVPTAHLSAKVMRTRDGTVLFERNIQYNPIDPGKAIDIFASSDFRFRDLDAMRADPQGVIAGMKAALTALALELEAQLRDARVRAITSPSSADTTPSHSESNLR